VAPLAPFSRCHADAANRPESRGGAITISTPVSSFPRRTRAVNPSIDAASVHTKCHAIVLRGDGLPIPGYFEVTHRCAERLSPVRLNDVSSLHILDLTAQSSRNLAGP
jgi:hypothetical protein